MRLTYDTDVKGSNNVRLSGEPRGERVTVEEIMGDVWRVRPRLVLHHCHQWGMSCKWRKRLRQWNCFLKLKTLHQVNRTHDYTNVPTQVCEMQTHTCTRRIIHLPVSWLVHGWSDLWLHTEANTSGLVSAIHRNQSQGSARDGLTSPSRDGKPTAHVATVLTDKMMNVMFSGFVSQMKPIVVFWWYCSCWLTAAA